MKNLFIYIPTYNRPKAIRTQLCALAPQVAKHQSRVRVLVIDNASSDYSFDEIIDDFSIYKNIKFQRNCGNIGGNGAIALGFAFAQADEFLWILSDHDIVTASALDYLLR
jgi:GT2 family glycosyltransferase